MLFDHLLADLDRQFVSAAALDEVFRHWTQANANLRNLLAVKRIGRSSHFGQLLLIDDRYNEIECYRICP